MSDMIRVSICDGKYTIVQDATGRTSVLRNGEAWRDAVGDGVILGAAYEIEELRERVEELERASAVALDAWRRVAANIRNELGARGVAGRGGNQWREVLTGCVSGGGVEEAIGVLEKVGGVEEKR